MSEKAISSAELIAKTLGSGGAVYDPRYPGGRQSAAQALSNLSDALVEDILSLSDDEVIAEVLENGEGPEEIAQRMRKLYERARSRVENSK